VRDVVIDTDVASLLQQGRAPAWVHRHVVGARVWLTFVTVAELAKWAEVRSWGEPARRRLDLWIARRPVIPYDAGGATVQRRETQLIPVDLDFCCGRDRRRSGDLPLFRRTLCRLSYPTLWVFARRAKVAVPTGFEPAASGLTGRRALQTAPRDRDVAAAPPTGFEPVLPP
jgi:hypothetical protein